jgi:curved DNA-binding protein CbpA
MKDYYKVLNISRNAESNEIKKSFHKMALLYHPDICKLANSHDLFIEIHEAYEILINIESRNAYNILFDDNLNEAFEKNIKQENYSTKYAKFYTEANAKAEEYYKMPLENLQTIVNNIFASIVEGAKKTFDFVTTLYAIIVAPIFIIGPFIGSYNYYKEITKWNLDLEGNKILGFICWTLVSIVILIAVILRIVNFIKQKS